MPPNATGHVPAPGTDQRPPVVVIRTIPGPPEPIFDAWLDPSSLRTWMCPGNVEYADVTVDGRPGGEFRIDMHERGGQVFSHRGAYLEITRPTRLVFTWISDATNNVASRVAVVLEARGADTELTLSHERLPAGEAEERHRQGWTAIIEKLAGRFTSAAR